MIDDPTAATRADGAECARRVALAYATCSLTPRASRPVPCVDDAEELLYAEAKRALRDGGFETARELLAHCKTHRRAGLYAAQIRAYEALCASGAIARAATGDLRRFLGGALAEDPASATVCRYAERLLGAGYNETILRALRPAEMEVALDAARAAPGHRARLRAVTAAGLTWTEALEAASRPRARAGGLRARGARRGRARAVAARARAACDEDGGGRGRGRRDVAAGREARAGGGAGGVRGVVVVVRAGPPVRATALGRRTENGGVVLPLASPWW